MEINNKFQKILTQLQNLSDRIDNGQENSDQFNQKVIQIIKGSMEIPFFYSKVFEDFITQQINDIYNNEYDIRIFNRWRSLIEKLQTTAILTQEKQELFLTLILMAINEIKENNKKVQAPSIIEYENVVNEQIKFQKDKSSSIIIDRNQDTFQQQQYPPQRPQSNQYLSQNIQDNQIPNRPKSIQYYQGDAQQNQQIYNNYEKMNTQMNYQNNQIPLQQNNQNQQQQQQPNQINYFSNNNLQNLQQDNNSYNNNILNNIQINRQNIYKQNHQQTYYVNQYQRQINQQDQFANQQKYVLLGIQEANSQIFESQRINESVDTGQDKRLIIENIDCIYQEENISINGNEEIEKGLYQLYFDNVLKSKDKEQMLTLVNFLLKTIHVNAEIEFGPLTLKANIFGSFLQGTSLSKESDVDVNLKFENKNISYNCALIFIDRICRYRLRNEEFQVTSVLTNWIRVPFITVTQMSTNFKVDFIYDNPLGVMNSQLFFTYLNIHQKIKILCVLFKMWAKKNNIKQQQSLTSYALMNMVIFFLIQQNIISSLQDHTVCKFDSKEQYIRCYIKKVETVIKVNNFATNLQEIRKNLLEKKSLKTLDLIPIQDLFIYLIKFYKQFCNNINNIPKLVITTIPQYLRGDLSSYQYCQQDISIQDPFDNTYNPGSRREFNLLNFINALNDFPEKIQNSAQIKQLF